MKKIIALGGSNSKKSINKELAQYTANQITNSETIVADLNDYELPLYGIDLENEKGIPDNAKQLNSLIEEADGIVISMAEHNGSYTAAFKNTIDWLSRINQKVWKDKPMFLMATSPGGRGGVTVLNTAKAAFPFFGGNVIADFSLPDFYDNYSKEGLKNKDLNETLGQKIQMFQEAI
ncbi:NADPH-dependent FMN reductase [Maribacter sp. HTCC2170]|uniref:NADPH-dependent FMN reductase n=1 Tax=Maribacter sp. (strain HTCC2170 / KCCM 42371) TaxID=313603 RepID=UPI00006B225E|nr:NADPH-dependent FMN reductase [Maribacter sp. HTCC2170]EAR00357.1 FMN reductase, NADPH-dependent [Maribacter sp. HTCC2170]